MSGYADTALAAVILGKTGTTVRGAAEAAELATQNTALSAQIDIYTHRTFVPSGTVDAPITWICDAPLGPVLALPDFSAVVQVRAYGVDVTGAVIPRRVIPLWAPTWQLLIYAPGGVPTGWIGTAATSLNALTIQVVAGWPTVPPTIAQATLEALCRKWRARGNMYTDSSGSVDTGAVATPAPLLDADIKSQIAGFVRDAAVAISGP